MDPYTSGLCSRQDRVYGANMAGSSASSTEGIVLHSSFCRSSCAERQGRRACLQSIDIFGDVCLHLASSLQLYACLFVDLQKGVMDLSRHNFTQLPLRIEGAVQILASNC